MAEWLTLKEAGDALGLKSIKQVRRRLKTERWRTRLNTNKGFMAVREVFAEDVNKSKPSSTPDEKPKNKEITDVPGHVPIDTQTMSRVAKDFIDVTNSIKTGFENIIAVQRNLTSLQEKRTQTEEKRLGIEKERLQIEKKKLRGERVKSIIWLFLSVGAFGIICVSIYFGYDKLSKQYKNDLVIREKKISFLNNVYTNTVKKYERELENKKLDIRDIKKWYENELTVTKAEIKNIKKDLDNQQQDLNAIKTHGEKGAKE